MDYQYTYVLNVIYVFCKLEGKAYEICALHQQFRFRNIFDKKNQIKNIFINNNDKSELQGIGKIKPLL